MKICTGFSFHGSINSACFTYIKKEAAEEINKNYLDTALLRYNWVNKKLLSPANLYFENIEVRSGKIDKRIFTYNAGTMLQSSVIQYHLSKEQKYLIHARK